MSALLAAIPPKYQHWFLFVLAVHPYVTRAIYSLKTGQGLRGLLASIWLGTNVPKTIAPVVTVTTPPETKTNP